MEKHRPTQKYMCFAIYFMMEKNRQYNGQTGQKDKQ